MVHYGAVLSVVQAGVRNKWLLEAVIDNKLVQLCLCWNEGNIPFFGLS